MVVCFSNGDTESALMSWKIGGMIRDRWKSKYWVSNPGKVVLLQATKTNGDVEAQLHYS
jgi:hypothetical protein